MPIAHIDIEGKKLNKPSRKKKILKIVAVVLVIVFIFGSFIGFLAYKKAAALAADAGQVSERVNSIQKAIGDEDVIRAKDGLVLLRGDLEKTRKELDSLGFVKYVPIIRGYYSDSQHSINAAIVGTAAGELVADSIIPFGDILGLKGVKGEHKAEKKLEVLVTKVLPSLSEKIEQLDSYFKQIKSEIDQIDQNRYPENFNVKGINVHNSIIQSKDTLVKIESALPLIEAGVDALPSILGYKKEKTYLIWFQNDKELRPTGGFITAYGIANIKDGKLLDVTSDDIYQLDKRLPSYETPPAPLQRYLLLKIFPIRDTNLSPDFKQSALKFESFYEKITSMPKIDGIVTIDTEVVRRFLELTGPITIKKFGETFSADLNPVYKIPDVVYKLELYAERVLVGQSDRKGLIGDLMDAMLDKLFNAQPKEFPKILDTFLKAAEEKHILFYMHDPKAQGLVEELNFGGRIVRNYSGDYLHINNANFAGLKGNLYIKAKVEQDIAVSRDGTVTKKVKVILRNTERADGWLNSVYQNWMRLYVPKGSKLIEKEVFRDFEEAEDLGYSVWESFSRTLPLSESVTSFTYELPMKVNQGEKYKMFIQKQPGIDPQVIIRYKGKVIKDFILLQDTEIEFET